MHSVWNLQNVSKVVLREIVARKRRTPLLTSVAMHSHALADIHIIAIGISFPE